MDIMPSVKKDYYDIDLELYDFVGFMKGDHTYFHNITKEEWERDSLERAAVAVILSNTEIKASITPARRICCFKLKHVYMPITLGKWPIRTQYFSYNEPFYSESNLEVRHVQPYYDWYAHFPLKQSITIHDGHQVILTKVASSGSPSKIDGKLHELIRYGFEMSYQRATRDALLDAAWSFANRILTNHMALLRQYVTIIINHVNDNARFFRSFGEFEAEGHTMALLIDSTGVYPNYRMKNGRVISAEESRDVLPNECQLQQMGLPKLTLVQQFGMGMAIRSVLEKTSKTKPIQMYDGTLVYHTLALRYETIDFLPNGNDSEVQYLGWIAKVYSLPVRVEKQTSW
jgi:hypothetical protein